MKKENNFYENGTKNNIPVLLGNFTDIIAVDIDNEIGRAVNKYPKFHSLHEAHSIIQEEFEEFWELVKQWKASNPDFYYDNVRKELIQMAAMAIRTIMDFDL